jgi:hypothetical protein
MTRRRIVYCLYIALVIGSWLFMASTWRFTGG